MPTKTTTNSHRRTKPVSAPPSTVYHRLDALLHTMRCIAQHEDALCELSHELKRTGQLSPELREEAEDLLDKIPFHDFQLDLDAARAELKVSRASTSSHAKKSAKSLPNRKRPMIAKKRPGRASSK